MLRVLGQIIEFTHHEPSTTSNYINHKRKPYRPDWFQLYADERHRINQMDAIHAKRGGGRGKWKTARIMFRKKCSHVTYAANRPRSDACYKSFRFIFHARWHARPALFPRYFRQSWLLFFVRSPDPSRVGPLGPLSENHPFVPAPNVSAMING